jgi:hypothetical protein
VKINFRKICPLAIGKILFYNFFAPTGCFRAFYFKEVFIMKKSTQSNLRRVLVGLALILGCITGYLTYNAYHSKFGTNATEDYLIAAGIGLVSAIVQAVFVFLIPRISYGPVKYGMVIACIAITGFTVYGMDMKVTQGTINNIVNSVSYQLKLKTAESYLKAADIQQQYDKATRSERNINRANEITRELDREMETGKGSANTRSDYENKEAGFDSGFWWKKAAGVLVDFMYYLVLWLIYFGIVIASGKSWDEILPEETRKEKKEEEITVEEIQSFTNSDNNGKPSETAYQERAEYSPIEMVTAETFRRPVGFTEPGYTAQDDNHAKTEPEVVETHTHTKERYYLTDEDRKKAEVFKESRRNFIKGLIAEYCKENPGHGGRKIANYVNKELEKLPLKSRRGKRLKNEISHTTALDIKKELQEENQL